MAKGKTGMKPSTQRNKSVPVKKSNKSTRKGEAYSASKRNRSAY